MKKLLIALACATTSISSASYAASDSQSVPTHCLPNETAFLNARIFSVDPKTSEPHGVGKIISLCADAAQEPLHKMVYRFGAPGNVEFEYVGDPAHKMGVFEGPSDPPVGNDIIYFSNIDYTYYITVETGMGTGVSLDVFKAGKAISHRESGADYTNVDTSGMEIDFSKSSSPIFVVKRPPDYRALYK